MRDRTKVIIGFGSIWGLWALGVLIFSAFSIGANDSRPEIIAFVLYGLTMFPACILAMWFRKYAATWLIILSAIAAFGFTYQLIAQGSNQKVEMMGRSLTFFVIAGIPALLGTLLLRGERS
jgi:hypothetical protein